MACADRTYPPQMQESTFPQHSRFQPPVGPSTPISRFEHSGCDIEEVTHSDIYAPSQCLGILYLMYTSEFKSTAKHLFSLPPLLCSIISRIHVKIRKSITHLWSWRSSGTLLNIRVILFDNTVKQDKNISKSILIPRKKDTDVNFSSSLTNRAVFVLCAPSK